MEMVRDALPGFEARPHAVKVQVGLGNYSLKVCDGGRVKAREGKVGEGGWSTAVGGAREEEVSRARNVREDRKSTRLNSSHLVISYAVFCLKKKMKRKQLDSNMIGQSPIRLRLTRFLRC